MTPVPIVALDVPDSATALNLADRIGPDGTWVKVGLQLFIAAGPSVVAALKEQGRRVFLDLKLHDIPNTVARAVESASSLGVDMLTVHVSGGDAMLRAASDSAGPDGPRLLAVTVLTSLPADGQQVVHLAEAAARAGITGAVASVHEAASIRQALGPDFAIVSPGIRLAGTPTHDQSRVATPGQAADAGVDYVVVGRAVTGAVDPRAALATIAEALARRT